MKFAVALVLAAVVASAATAASASTKTLQSDPRIDAIASGIAGFAMTVEGDDDQTDWDQLVASQNINCPNCLAVNGFAFPFAQPGDWRYHADFLSPSAWSTLEAIENAGITSVDLYSAANAIFLLTHETYHHKLGSLDEGKVNACTLVAFPDVVSTYFDVPPTIEQTTTRTTTVLVRHVYYVRVHGRRVRRVRLVPRTVTTSTTGQVSNPTYIALTSDAQAIYASEPPPYSNGTCS